ncbi:MAG: type II secretion system F family protein, partial [Alphaproteobacteria bacterium]|nr:type II secretion system F family protein [Alphaproteobacteria bacterium]
RSKDAIYIFSFFKLNLPFIYVAASLIYVVTAMEDNPAMWKWLIPVVAIYLGMRLPEFYVDRKRKKRYIMIQRALADTLDLLMICAEAGLSLAQGLERVSKELKNAYPEMADELGLTSIELSFQPDRQKTLNALAKRIQLQEVKGIVNVLIQTEKYGTPIAQALRTLSAEFRTQRMLRAEQKAARLPAIMTVPMIVFILPTLFIVVIAPAAIGLLNTM